MSRNPVSVAIELVELTPSPEFRTNLRTQLLADLAEQDAPVVPDPTEEYVTLSPSPSRIGRRSRVTKTLLAAAACVAVLVTGAVIVDRAGDDSQATAELNDVDLQEALPLAERALITSGALGLEWNTGYSWGESEMPTQAATLIAALPDCAVLRSVGLLQPSPKSATAHQHIAGTYSFQQVFVFATSEDATRAMDVIDGDVFPTCWFNLFDRLTRPGRATEAWQIPKVYGPLEPFVIGPHGDRQIVVGQHSASSGGAGERYFINAFVQVGRTISWVNPQFVLPNNMADGSPRSVGVDEVITAAASALKSAVDR